MTIPKDSADRSPVPPLSELLARYLDRQARACNAGLATANLDVEITPYEAIPVQSIDARLAWSEAIGVAPFYDTAKQAKTFQLAPDWPSLVANQEPEAAVPFCFGNFPQLVRNLQALLRARDLAALRPATAREPLPVPGVVAWAEEQTRNANLPQTLLAIGVLRLARHYDLAESALERVQAGTSPEWQAAAANEKAALLWEAGRSEEAAALWHAQPSSVPVCFNRGMSALFLNGRDEARTWLHQAIEALPDLDGWHHLGRLYLALAEMA
jgi:tetratricopeptide (TPR) repeat protein